MEDTMYLQGMFNSDEFQFLKIYVSDCINSTVPRQKGQWDPICASQKQIDSTLKTEGVHSLSIIMTSSLINSQNETNWHQYYLNDDHYYTFIPKAMIKTTNTYFRLYNMVSDVSIWPYDQITNESVFSYQTGDMQEKVEMNRNDGQYAILYIRRSPFTQYNSRRYQKFSEIMSSLGGFIQIIFIIFRQNLSNNLTVQSQQTHFLMIIVNSFFLKKYNRVNLSIDLANQLYDFQTPDNKTQKQLQIQHNQKSIIQDNKDQTIIRSKNNQSISKKSPNSLSKKLDFVNIEESIKLDSLGVVKNSNKQSIIINSKGKKISKEMKTLQLSPPYLCVNASPVINKSIQKSLVKTDYNELHTDTNTPIFPLHQYPKNDKLVVQFQANNDNYDQNQHLKDDKNRKEEERTKNYFISIKNEIQSLKKEEKKPFFIWRIFGKIKEKKKEGQEKIKKSLQKDRSSLQSVNEKELPFSEKVKYIVIKFRQLIKEKEKVFLSSTLLICFKKQYQKWLMLQKAFQFIRNDLDICVIISKIQEMQKMKSLIFNQEQETIFNFIPKPTISLSSNLQQLNRQILMKQPTLNRISVHSSQNDIINNKEVPALATRMTYDSLSAYQILFESYQKIKQEDHEQVCLKYFLVSLNYDILQIKRLNQKLIKYLGNDLCELFDAYGFLLKNPKTTLRANGATTLEQSKYFNIQYNDDPNEGATLNNMKKSLFVNIFNKEHENNQPSIKLGLEQLDQLMNDNTQFDEICQEESEITSQITSSLQDDQSIKDSSISNQLENVSFQNNISFLNNQNVISNYYDRTIKEHMKNNSKVE